MESRKMIIFLGAPTAKDVLKTWDKPSLHQNDDTSSLPPFSLDPENKTCGVVWRRLPDPIESLPQELADSSMESHSLEDAALEKSLRIYAQDDDDDNEDDEDIFDRSETLALSVSSIDTPFLTKYDFDVNEITELEDLPSANIIARSLHRNYSIIVAIVEMSSCQLVMTRFGKSIPLVKLIVADQTRGNLEIACWDAMALLTQSMRKDDIIYFRGMYRN